MKNRIKEFRVKNNLYQEALGQMTESSQQTISNIETGKIIPTIDVAGNIARVFDVSLDTLFCFTDENRPLDYNEQLYLLAKEYKDILNLLNIMNKDDVKRIYVIAQAFVDDDIKKKK